MTASLLLSNCAPVAAAGSDLFWYAKVGKVWQPFVGNAKAGRVLPLVQGVS